MGLRSYLRGKDIQERLIGPPLSTGTSSASYAGLTGQLPPPKSALLPKGGLTAKTANRPLFKAAGRQSRPSSATLMGVNMAWLPRHQSLASLETIDMTRMAPEEVIEIISNVSPEVAMAIWNNNRLANSGYNVAVQNKDGSDDPKGLDIANAFLKRVNTANWGGGLNPLLDTLHLIAYLEGAVCAETPPAAGLAQVEDIYLVRPASLRFRWLNMGTEEQPDFRLGMQQWVLSMHQPIWLNPQQTVFIPLDAYVDDPYGRAPAHAAVGAVLFWLDVLRDLRRVLHTSTFGRLKVQVLVEKLWQQTPPEIQSETPRWEAYLKEKLDEIAEAYSSMEPDDSVIYTDMIDVGEIQGSQAAFQIDPLLRSLETLIIRGLKQLPTLMGGVSSRGAAALGTLEYQIMSSGILALQRMSASVMEFSINLDLRLHGRQSEAAFEYQPIRTTDRLKDAQAEALEIQNATRKRDEGFVDQREAALEITGHEPAENGPIRQQGPQLSTLDRPSPPPMPTNGQNPADGLNPNAKHPSVGQTTGEGGDQIGAPQPAPSREWLAELIDEMERHTITDGMIDEAIAYLQAYRPLVEA